MRICNAQSPHKLETAWTKLQSGRHAGSRSHERRGVFFVKTIARSVFKLNHLPCWAREVEVWGNRITATSLDRLLNLYLHHLGVRGGPEKRFLAQHVRPGMQVLDIGANQGLCTLLLSQIVGKEGHVFAFEPDPVLFYSLRKHCEENGAVNLELHNIALGHKPGVMKLYRCQVNSGDNRLAKSRHPGWFEEVEVHVAPLDSILDATRIDFVKIDVQGWEYQVFLGMERILRESPGVKIFFEYWPLGLKSAGCQPADCLGYLRSLGFSLSRVSALGSTPVRDFEEFTRSLGRRRSVNLFAVRET